VELPLSLDNSASFKSLIRIPARHASPPGNRLTAKPMADGQGEAGGSKSETNSNHQNPNDRNTKQVFSSIDVLNI